jgi:hypothetical protein
LAGRIKIDAAELIGVQSSDDGTRLHLKLLDQAGETVSLSLPAGCLNAVITAIPQGVENGAVHPLDTWSMGPAENGQDFLLTLRTAEGLTVSFTIKRWQAEGMATIATYGSAPRTPGRLVH